MKSIKIIQTTNKSSKNSRLVASEGSISSSYPSLIVSPKDSIAEKGAYLFQSIMANGNTMNIYDNGCSDFVVSSKGVQLLGSSAYKFDNQPILLKGVGESVISSLGSYHVSLPL